MINWFEQTAVSLLLNCLIGMSIIVNKMNANNAIVVVVALTLISAPLEIRYVTTSV